MWVSFSFRHRNPQARTIKINSGIKIFQRVFLLIKHIKLQTGEIISTKSSSTYRVFFFCFFFCILFCLSALDARYGGFFARAIPIFYAQLTRKKALRTKKKRKKRKRQTAKPKTSNTYNHLTVKETLSRM